MRRLGWLLPLIIFGASAALFVDYQNRVRAQEQAKPKKPDALPSGIASKANRWVAAQDGKDGKPKYEIRADSFRMLEQEGLMELTNVELDLFEKKDPEKFNRIVSAKAQFNPNTRILFSEGNVKITLGMKEAMREDPKLLRIESSGVTLDANSGRVSTEKPTKFHYDSGEGEAIGATYEPISHEIRLLHDAKLRWRGGQQEMLVESGDATYKELDQKVFLGPWSRLTRGKMVLNATTSEVRLDKGAIRQVLALQAKGHDEQPKQKIDYQADELEMLFNEKSDVDHIKGSKNARLASDSAVQYTLVTANRVDLNFQPGAGGSALKQAVTNGNGVVESRPKPQPNQQLPATRLMRSDVIEMNMRPGGEEILSVVTHTPGVIEFLPNSKGQRKRAITGERMNIDYGARNTIERFRAVEATTRTEPEDPNKQQPLLTWSKDLQAQFDEAGDLKTLEQWQEFRFEEGIRRGKADRATFDQKTQVITLDGAARVLDDTGSTEGLKITMNQVSGEFTAEGKVYSTRLPEKKEKPKAADAKAPESGNLLSGDIPMQAKADRMVSTDKNQVIRYFGNSIVWQGSDRVKADQIEIRRKEGIFLARGNVFSQFQDKKSEKPSEKASTTGITFTVVRAASLDYNDKDRLALYRDKVQLERPGMIVKSKELRAFFVEDGNGGSKVDHTFADGQVVIDQENKGRKRNSRSEHAEYYLDSEKVVLEGGGPVVVDSVRGTTRGKRITLFSKEDRLTVEGETSAPAETKLNSKSRD